MLNLLHRSDLHFGYDRTPLARKLRAGTLDLRISGDLTWQGKKEGYVELRTWLETKTPADCVFGPGNQDIDRKAIRLWVKSDSSAGEAANCLIACKPHSTMSHGINPSPRSVNRSAAGMPPFFSRAQPGVARRPRLER